MKNRRIRVGDYVRVRGHGANEVVALVVRRRPGVVWCQHSSQIAWQFRPRDVRPANAAEIRRALARGVVSSTELERGP